MTDIARLLAQSLQAHQDAKRARNSRKPALCREHWQTALNARMDAHALDPKHTDPAWAEEQAKTPHAYDTHTEMLQFYAERGVVYQGDQPQVIQPVARAPWTPDPACLQEQADRARIEIAALMESAKA